VKKCIESVGERDSSSSQPNSIQLRRPQAQGKARRAIDAVVVLLDAEVDEMLD